jgi:hypothetical protein
MADDPLTNVWTSAHEDLAELLDCCTLVLRAGFQDGPHVPALDVGAEPLDSEPWLLEAGVQDDGSLYLHLEVWARPDDPAVVLLVLSTGFDDHELRDDVEDIAADFAEVYGKPVRAVVLVQWDERPEILYEASA